MTNEQSRASILSSRLLPLLSKRVFPDAWLDAGDDRDRLEKVAKKRRGFDGPRPDAVLERRWVRATTEIHGRELHLLTPRSGPTGKVLFYCHGGAFVVGPGAAEWAFAARLAELLELDLALYDYPKVPSVDNRSIRSSTLEAWDEIAARYRADRIVIGGTSAGAGLAVSTMLRLAKQGRPLPRAAILVSPWLDMTVSHPDTAGLESSDKLLPIRKLRRDGELYCGDDDSHDPLISPRFATSAELSALPPTQVIAGERELLRPEAEQFVADLVAAGGQAGLHLEAYGQHAGAMAPTPEGRVAVESAIQKLAV